MPAPAALTVADMSDYLVTADDFQFELEVLRHCREADLFVSHSGTYEDPTTKKPRQFDIRAHVQREKRAIRLAIECKSLRPSRPVFVSRVPRVANEQQHDIVRSWDPLTKSKSATTFRVRPIASMYPRTVMVGKSVKQPTRTKEGWRDADSEVYDKWAQALASCRDLILDAGTTATTKTPTVFTLVLSILVVRDDTLWAVDYDLYGKMQEPPRQISSAEVYVAKEYIVNFETRGVTQQYGNCRYMLSHLHVFTLSGFKKWVGSIGIMLQWDDLVPLNQSGEVDGEQLS
jgi:hypothetical protein